MSSPSRDDLLTLALGVLPELPGVVDVLSEDGGSFALQFEQRDGDLVRALAPAQGVRVGVNLLARVFDQARGRYEVEFEVVETFFHSGVETLADLAVTGVRHRKARRVSPRLQVSVPLNAHIRYCGTMPRDTEIEVRLVDISVTGLAFVTQRELAPGDIVALEFPLSGQRISAEARVVRLDPAPYGRHRAGCEITELSDEGRRTITDLAGQVEGDGSERQRSPEEIAARAEARGGGGLSARLSAHQ